MACFLAGAGLAFLAADFLALLAGALALTVLVVVGDDLTLGAALLATGDFLGVLGAAGFFLAVLDFISFLAIVLVGRTTIFLDLAAAGASLGAGLAALDFLTVLTDLVLAEPFWFSPTLKRPPPKN